jgi:hypothetical protein
MDLYNNVLPVLLLQPAALINDTDTKSKLLDVLGFSKSEVVIALGDLTGVDADSILSLTLQESNTTADTDFTAVAVAQMNRSVTGLASESTAGLFATVNATTEDIVNYRAEYLGTKRYIRVLCDFTTGSGGISSAYITVIGLLSGARHAPASAPAPVTAT